MVEKVENESEWEQIHEYYIHPLQIHLSCNTTNNVQIPQTEAVKYLRPYLDNKLIWNHHITKKEKGSKNQNNQTAVTDGKKITGRY